MDKPAQDDIERLILDLKDDRRDVRSRAAYELGKSEDPRIVEPLIAALSDNDKFVRSWAAGALSKAGSQAIAPLLVALATPDVTIGYYAALALGELGDIRAVPLLAQALREGDWDIRPSAASALAGLGDMSTLPERILTEEEITGAERAKILRSLRAVAYTDDQVQIHYDIPDAADFCRQRSQSADDAIRMGAVETLQALETAPRSEATQETAAPILETPAETPVAQHSEEAATAGRRQPADAPGKPKRSLWDRLTGRKAD